MEDLKKTIEELVQKTGFNVEELIFCEETNGLWCCVRSSDSPSFIGRGGETLSALNYLAKRIIENKKIENPPDIFIDVNDYQKKKVESLKNKAFLMAERARFFKTNIEIEPMPAMERKIIHQYLTDATDVKTESEGRGEDRHVVIKYAPTTGI